MRLAVTREGAAVFYIPDPSNAYIGGRLEPSWLGVFYNPHMEANRDISVIALEAYTLFYAPHKPVNIVDGFTATGIRAVRYAIENTNVGLVYASDIDEQAAYLARLNVGLNRLEDKVKVYRTDFRELLYRLRLQREPILYIDVDPYGTPQPFLQPSLEVVGHRGMIGVTATDLAVLEGGKPRVAYRRYGSRIVKTVLSKEVAVRTLLGYIARVAASLDKSIRPLLSYYNGHYIRLFAVVERGAKRADAMINSSMGYAHYCWASGFMLLDKEYQILSCPRGEKPLTLGPLWIGGTVDPGFLVECKRLLRDRYRYVSSHDKILKLLETLIGESEIQDKIFVSLVDVARSLGLNVPKRDHIIEALRELGYKAVKTHYSSTGLRTNANIFEVYKSIVEYWASKRVKSV